MSPLEPVALLGPTQARKPAWPIAPVLIQVPDLSAAARRRAWDSAGDRFRPRPSSGRQPRAQVRRKRRLRKEVRVMGALLMIVLPASWLFWNVPWERAAAANAGRVVAKKAIASAIVVRGGEAEPIVSLTLEPMASSASPAKASPAREILGPVALPGYILPVEGSEEAAHAGS